MNPFIAVADAMNRAGVRYVVVGGWAVVLRGHVRLTMDIDLCIALDESNAKKAVQALLDLGMEPRIPVNALDFADPIIRQGWTEQKNMLAFSMANPNNPFFSADLLFGTPISFEELEARSEPIVTEGVEVKVCSVSDLIAMKRHSARGQDLVDAKALEDIYDR